MTGPEKTMEPNVSVSTPPAAPPASGASTLLHSVTQNLQSYMLVIALLVIWIGFGVAAPGYASTDHVQNIFAQMATIGIMATGMVFVIVTGGIDLSVGYGSGFVSVVVAALLYHGVADRWVSAVLPGLGTSIGYGPHALATAALVVTFGLLLGVLMGASQGFIISRLGVPPFIVTLGGFSIFKSGILVITQGKVLFVNAYQTFKSIGQGYVPPLGGLLLALLVTVVLFIQVFTTRARKRKYGAATSPLLLPLLRAALFSALAIAYVLIVNHTFTKAAGVRGVPILVVILGVVALLMSYLSQRTRFGRYAYAYGGNREAARLSGVDTKNVILKVYILMGLLMGVSGVALAGYVGMGTTAAGAGAELDVIASCILGGTSTLGGVGTVSGALVGALIMQSLGNGLQMMDVQSSWQYAIKGFVLILAVFADIQFKKGR
jgi:D-xylose transport system permease protein